MVVDPEKSEYTWWWIQRNPKLYPYIKRRILKILREKSFLIKRKSKNSSLQRKRNPLFKKKRNPFSWIQNYGCSSTRKKLPRELS